MPKIIIGDSTLTVRLSVVEKLAAMRGDVTVALSAVRAVHITHHPYTDLRGWRAPGTGIPGILSYGQRRRIGGKDFAAVLGFGRVKGSLPRGLSGAIRATRGAPLFVHLSSNCQQDPR